MQQIFIGTVSFRLVGNEQRYVFVADFGARHCQTTMKFEASYNR
jgi:hypothetical protein